MTRMITAYRHAQRYADDGVVRLQYRRSGQQFEDEAPLRVCWQSPNRLHVLAYQAEVACDGSRLLARIRDEATRDFDGQVVVRSAPATLTLEELWEKDEILSLAFRQGLAGYPLQLDLLLSDEPLAALMQEDVKRSLLESATLDGTLCHRVNIPTADGTFVLWVDQASYLLRRVEYPVETFAPEIAEDPAVDEVSLTVECRAASFGKRAGADSFAFQVPAQAKRVKRLIPPPRELPSDLFGKTTAPYAFATLNGGTVSSESLGDQIKVFVWFNNHPACQSTIQQLNQVYQQYQSQRRVAIHAVCAEASRFTDQQLRTLTRQWHVNLPVVRDVQAFGRDLFQIPWAPTLVVLDAENAVQIYEVGANPNLVAELPQVIEQLLAGKDVAGAILDQFRQEETRYELALQRGEPEQSADEADAAPLASRSMPQVLQLRPLWQNQDLTATGNVLAIRGRDQADRFLIHEGWRTIAELGGQGSLLGHHTLDLPDQAGVGQLQSAVDAAGHRYYVGWSTRSAQVHVFDALWKRILSYPPLAADHEGVQDAMLADLDGNGQLELHVGYWGTRGVDCVALSGKLLWNHQELTHVLSLMESLPEDGRRTLWVSSATGAVVRLDHHGRGERVDQHTGQLTHQLFGSLAVTGSAPPYCGICYGAEGRRLAVGLGADGQSQWRYSLPAGSFAAPVRFVTSARLLDEHASHWIIAGADGSVHIISQDGRFTDHFNTGSAISGVAGGRLNSAGVLVVSSDEGVHAWQVSPPATARSE